jgi:pilus assembly protein Flp/PilA
MVARSQHSGRCPAWKFGQRGTAMGQTFKRFLADERGAVMMEYGVIAGGIALAVLAGVQSLGTELGSLRDTILTALQSINGMR